MTFLPNQHKMKETHKTKDKKLLEQIQANDQNAIKHFYLEQRSVFLGWLQKNYQCNEELGKDIYQISFLTCIENIQTQKITQLTSSLRVYLFGIGKNVYRSYQRKNNNVTLVKDDLLFERVDSENQTEEIQQKKENRLKQLAIALQELGEPCKSLLESFYYLQQSMQEIVNRLGYKNTHSARNQKYKCVERLKKLVQQSKLAQL